MCSTANSIKSDANADLDAIVLGEKKSRKKDRPWDLDYVWDLAYYWIEARGLSGFEKVGDVDAGIEEALAIDRPVFIDVSVYQYENCYPMIPAGGSNHEMLLADPPDLKKPKSTNKAAVQADSDTVLTA